MTTLQTTLRPLALRVQDGIVLLLSLPFVLIGMIAGWVVAVTLWIVAAVVTGYAAGRGYADTNTPRL